MNMNTEVLVKGFAKTDSMEAYLRAHTENLIEPFLKSGSDKREVSMRVIVGEDSHRTQTRKPHFTCEVHLNLPGNGKFIKIKKQGTDFYECVGKVGQTLKQVLRRRSELRSNKSQRRVAIQERQERSAA